MVDRLHDYEENEWAYGEDIEEEFDQILNLLTGNLTHTHLSANAGILGSQHADAPNGLTTDKYNDDSVTGNKIAHGANGVDTINLADGAVERAKIGTAAVGEDELDFTDAKILHAGAAGLKIARGYKLVSLTTNGAWYNSTLTFATDSDDGDPSFSAAPRIICTYVDSAATTINTYGIRISGLTATSCSINVMAVSGAPGDIDVHWIAIGPA